MTETFEITSDEDLKTIVRTLTMYEDSSRGLPTEILEGQIQAAKLRLATRTDSTEWYSDRGLGLALAATTAILTKCAVENYSISRWDIGAAHIDVYDTSQAEAAQFQQWASMVEEGLEMAETGSRGPHPTFTKTYVKGYRGDRRARR